MERQIHLLLFSGLCLFMRSISCQYILIQEQKPWNEAQAYCRENYIDLATVQSIEDWAYVQDTVQPALTTVAWTGLYNDVNGWRWSHEDENITFMTWLSGQPNNKFSNQECIALEGEMWNDHTCTEKFVLLCFNENETDRNRYVLITDLMGWCDAQSYCRQHYTDLATIRSQTENDQLVQMLREVGMFGTKTWIGMFRMGWQWSDGTIFTNTVMNWMIGQPNIVGNISPCGTIVPGGMIDDQLCSDALPFICMCCPRKQIVRVMVKSGQNPADVMETILQWIKQRLMDHGIEKDTTVTWRVQPDGNVFSKKLN